MITQSVITTALIGIVITGIIPIIGGIVLLAAGKIKASSFWAGVLAYIIGIITASIAAVIISVASASGSGITVTESAGLSVLTVTVMLIQGVLLALSMGICIKSCMKKRGFNAALSCGLGYAAAHTVSAAVSFISLYMVFASVNSGAFDMQYANFVKMGAMTKEQVAELKAVYTGYTVAALVNMILTNVFFAAVLAAAAVFIMRAVCTGKAFLGICSAAAALSLCGIGSIIPNAAAAAIVTAAIGIAALIFAVRMKEQVVVPEKKEVIDPFMASVENAQKDNN